MNYYPGTWYPRELLTPEDLAIVSRSAPATMFQLSAFENDCDSFYDMVDREWHRANNKPPYRRSPANWERLGWRE